MKKFFLIIGVSILSVIFVYVFLLPIIARADYHSGNFIVEDRLEVSKDNGVSYHNYYADTSAGNETLTVKPGDHLLFRIKIWNKTQAIFAIVQASSYITQGSQYVSSNTVFSNANEDGDVSLYLGDIGYNGGVATILLPEGNGDKDHFYQSGTYAATIKDNAIDGAIIIAQMRVISVQDGNVGWLKRILLPRAFAQANEAISTVRIAVNNPPTEQIVPTTLPATGSDILNILDILNVLNLNLIN